MTRTAPPDAAIIGAGPAGLMAAETLARAGVGVTVYDRMPSAGRKFLLAGRGGLNLTHSEELSRFMQRYGAAASFLRSAIEAFPPSAVRAWCESLGQPVFVGSSGRVFPRTMKASPLLRAWLTRLRELNVQFRMRHSWAGWDPDGRVFFDTPAGRVSAAPSVTVFALGGASWPRLGSDGHWATLFADSGITVSPLKPSNCGFIADFSVVFRARFEGSPLKGIELRFDGIKLRGEAVITKTGLEGGAIYALSAYLREAIEHSGEAFIAIDLRPGISSVDLASMLSKSRGKQSISSHLRKAAKLSPVAAGLLQESARRSGTPLSLFNAAELAALIKAVPVRLLATAPIDRAISTAGGIALEEIDKRFMLHRKPGTFVAGEMIDWEAPTGGYLLQACFATGVAAGQGAKGWIDRESQGSGCRGADTGHMPLHAPQPEC